VGEFFADFDRYVTSFIGGPLDAIGLSARFVSRADMGDREGMRAPLAMLPKGAITIVREVARHLLKRPVIGVAAVARTRDGRWLLIRRADMGTWALAGGTLEWGETMRDALRRELEEEAGVTSSEFVRVVGVYSRPDRDPRFHGVTVAVECIVDPPTNSPQNPLEILEARLFTDAELPAKLAMGMEDMIADAKMKDAPTFE
jgi:8-oxo-dGTP diphosphatase